MKKKIKVAVSALDNAPLSSLALSVDILNAAGVLWNKMAGKPVDPFFEVSITTPGGKAVSCYNSVTIQPDIVFESIEPPDVVLIGALADLTGFEDNYQTTIEHLRILNERGTILASICSGAFLLAATGLLDGKRATTHWGMSRQFLELFPLVRITSAKTVVEEGTLLSSGGTTSGADLSLYLIRKFCGNEIAEKAARVLLLDPYRSSQLPYEWFNAPVDHGDAEVILAQDWIDQHYSVDISITDLGQMCNLSRRTFERRFKKATGNSPLRYLQRIRIEKAKQMLETGRRTFEKITVSVGYEDTSTFRKMFQKITGLAPSVYREKFRRAKE